MDKPQNFVNRTAVSQTKKESSSIRESLENKKTKANKRRKVLNCDEGNLVKTNMWTTLFAKLTGKETNTKTRRQLRLKKALTNKAKILQIFF